MLFRSGSGTSKYIYCYYCHFIGDFVTRRVCIYPVSGGNAGTGRGYAENCTFTFFSYAMYNSNTKSAVQDFNLCNFYDGTSTSYMTQVSGWGFGGNVYVDNCMLDTAVRGWHSEAGCSCSGTGNHFYNVTGYESGNVYTTDLPANNIDTDPEFASPIAGVLYPKVLSSYGRNVGAFLGGGFATGAENIGSGGDSTWQYNGVTADNTGWYNPDENAEYDIATDSFKLLDGSGDVVAVLWSPVYDLGNTTGVERFNLSVLSNDGGYDIDTTDTTDTPNYQNLEVRVSSSSFDQDDAVIAWTTVRRNIDMDTIMVGRYSQVRITMRNNYIER